MITIFSGVVFNNMLSRHCSRKLGRIRVKTDTATLSSSFLEIGLKSSTTTCLPRVHTRGVMRTGRCWTVSFVRAYGLTVSFKGFNSELVLCPEDLGGSFPGGGVPSGERLGGFLDNWEYSFFIVWKFTP